MKPTYGFTKASDVDDKASALRRIIAAHEEASAQPQVSPQEALARLRAVHAADKAKYEEQQEAYREQARQNALNPESVVEEPVVVAAAPVVTPEPVVDFRDGSWIEVRTPEMLPFHENDGEGREPVKRFISTGRYLSTWRKRGPSDGDAPVIFAAPSIPAPAPPQRMQSHKWFDSESHRAPGESQASIRARHEQENNAPRTGSFTPRSLVR